MNERDILDKVDALHLKYARALDGRDMAAWAGCFDTRASYTCTTQESVEQGLPIALMLDDNRERVEDRVQYVTRVWAGTVEEYRTRHFVQRLSCKHREADVYEVESQFLVAYTTVRGQSELLVAGLYVDEIAIDGGEARLRSRKAVLDAEVTPRYLVYPV